MVLRLGVLRREALGLEVVFCSGLQRGHRHHWAVREDHLRGFRKDRRLHRLHLRRDYTSRTLVMPQKVAGARVVSAILACRRDCADYWAIAEVDLRHGYPQPPSMKSC